MKSEPDARLVTKIVFYYHSLAIASYFVCKTPLTIVLLTLFQELLKKGPMVMILSVFLTLSSYSLTICDAIRIKDYWTGAAIVKCASPEGDF